MPSPFATFPITTPADTVDNDSLALDSSDPDYVDFSRSVSKPPTAKPADEPRTTLAEETGTFLLSHYGDGYALGFKGEPGFVNRCFNWAMNTGLISLSSRLMWFYGDNGRLGYVCVRSKEAIAKALALQFAAEIMTSHEIEPTEIVVDYPTDPDCDEPVTELSFDEAAVNRLAEERATEFMNTRVIADNFFLQRSSAIAHVYSTGYRSRAEAPVGGWDT